MKKYRTVFVEEPLIALKGVALGTHVALPRIDIAIEQWSKLGWSVHTIQATGETRSGGGQSFFVTFEIEVDQQDVA